MLVCHNNRAVASGPYPRTPRAFRAIQLFACTMVLSCVFGALQPLTVGASATFALPRAVHPGDLKVVGIGGDQRHVERSYVLYDAANKPHRETLRKRHATSETRGGHRARDTKASVNDTQIIQENSQPVPTLSLVHSSLVSPTVKTPGALISISSTEKLSQETSEIPKITVESDTTLSPEGLVSPTESVSSATQGSIVPEITAPPLNTTTKEPAQETSTEESLVSNLAAASTPALVPTVGATSGDTVEASPVLDPVIPVIPSANLEPETTGNKIFNTVPKTKTNLSPIARTEVAQGDSGTTTQPSPIGTSALGRGQSDNQVVTQIQTLTSSNLSDITSSGDNTAIATPDSTSAQDLQATTTGTVPIEAPNSATETTNVAEGPTSPPFVNPETSQTPSTKSPTPTDIASGATDAAAPTNTNLAATVISPITTIYGSTDVTSATSITSVASITTVAATIAPITTAATPIATDGTTDSTSITPAAIPAATSATATIDTDTDDTTANTTAATTSDITPIIASTTTTSNTTSISTSNNTPVAANVATTAATSPVIVSVPTTAPTGPGATTATPGPEPITSTTKPSTVTQLASSPSTEGLASSLATSQLAPISTNSVATSSAITTSSPTNPTTAAPTDPLATENSTIFSSATQPSILLSSVDQTSEPPTPIGTRTGAVTPTEAVQNASSTPIPPVSLQSAVVESSSIKPTFEPTTFITATSRTINPSVIFSSSQTAKGSPSPDPNPNSSQIVPAATPTPAAPVDVPEVVVPITRTSDIPPSAVVTAGTSIDKDGNKVQLVTFHDTTSDQTSGTNNTIAFEGSATNLDTPFSLIFVMVTALVGQLFVW